MRKLKIPLDGWSLEAKSSTVKRVAEMITQDYVTCFAMKAAKATSSSAAKRDTEIVTKESHVFYARATNTLAIFGRLHDKSRFR